jgi:hypothetical protein
MAKPLTAIAVKSFKSGKARRETPDGGSPGLYLVVQTSGQSHGRFASGDRMAGLPN